MRNVIEKIGQVDLDIIRSELSRLPEYDTQIMLQTNLNGAKDHTFGIDAVKTLNGLTEDSFKYPIFDFPYINGIIEQYGLFRSRVMCMHEKTCYSYHHDFTPRLHIPVQTNENCFFIIDDLLYRLPADGTVYLVNTTLAHTFVNASWHDRIHIVGCQTDTDEE